MAVRFLFRVGGFDGVFSVDVHFWERMIGSTGGGKGAREGTWNSSTFCWGCGGILGGWFVMIRRGGNNGRVFVDGGVGRQSEGDRGYAWQGEF